MNARWEYKIHICCPEGRKEVEMQDEKKKKKKKGIFGAIRESMTKTGGCCGPGETCGGSSGASDTGKATGKDAKGPDRSEKK